MGTLLLLSALLSADSEEPPTPVSVTAPLLPAEGAKPAQAPGPAAPPPAPPERWALMKALQGTWPGWLLDGNRLAVYGWTDMSFTASSDSHEQLPMGFNYKANQFLLQQNWLRIERPVDQAATTPTFGFRSDTFVGTDYRFTVARGLFSGQLTANDGEPNTYGIDPIQLYAEGYFPQVARGLDVKFGRFFAQYGAESNDATQNVLGSRSYTFIYDPFTHTGLLTTLQITPAWSVQNGLVTGSDVFIDPAARPTYIGSVKWAPPNGRDSVLFSVILGPGRFEPERNFNNPEIFDVVFTHKLSGRLTYTLDALFGFQSNVPEIGTATWFSTVHYLTRTLSPRLSATARLEFFDDIDGQRTGFKGLYTALTTGLTFKPHRALWLRPEVRFDYNDESRPFEGKHGLFTADMDVILRW
jgi:hypothetical protein